MLQRKGSNRFGQQKSIPSGWSGFIDSEISRQQAFTAAHLAFNRAPGWESTNDGHNTQAKVSQTFQDKSNTTRLESELPVKRQQSVRFAGPTAIRKRQSIGNRAAGDLIRHSTSSSLKSVTISSSTAVPTKTHSLDRLSSISKLTGAKTTTTTHFAGDSSNERFTDYEKNEVISQSAISSYRRIRKCKSVSGQIEASNISYHRNTPGRPEIHQDRSSRNYNSQISKSQPPQEALTAPKSIKSLLAKRYESEANDKAVQLAQDRFLYETAQQLTREKPSFLHRSKSLRRRKKSQKPICNGSITCTDLLAASSIQCQAPKDSVIKSVACKASKSLGNKFKKAFGRSTDDPIVTSSQQDDIKEANDGRYNRGSCLVDKLSRETPQYDRASLARVVSCVPSICKAASNAKATSQSGSIKSFTTDTTDDKSRVGSWTSTYLNRVADQGPVKPLPTDDQRLSIINENTTSAISSSFKPGRLANKFPTHAFFHKKTQGTDGKFPPPISVDSARVYSALMKRLALNGSTSKSEAPRRSSSGCSASPRRSVEIEISAYDTRNRDLATIRHVTPEDTASEIIYASEEHDKSCKKTDFMPSAEDVFGDIGSYVSQRIGAEPPDQILVGSKKGVDVIYSKDNCTNHEGNLPGEDSQIQQTTLVNRPLERSIQKVDHEPYQGISGKDESQIPESPPTVESKPVSFSRDKVEIQSSVSPFQQAIKGGDSPLRASPTQSRPRRNTLDISPQCAHSINLHENQTIEPAYTESIYSCDTNGQSQAFGRSSWSLPHEKDEEPAVSLPPPPTSDAMLVDKVLCQPKIPTNKNHHIITSSSSAERKTWLSSDVAKFERSKENARCTMYTLPIIPNLFHKENFAEELQITDKIPSKSKRQTSISTQPLGVVQQQDPNIQNSPLLNRTLLKRYPISASPEDSVKELAAIQGIQIPYSSTIPETHVLNKVQSTTPVRSVMVNTLDTTNKNSSEKRRNFLQYRNKSYTSLPTTASDTAVEGLKKSTKLQRRHASRLTDSPHPSPIRVRFDHVGRSISTSSKYSDSELRAEPSVKNDRIDRPCEREVMNNSPIDAMGMKSPTLQMFLSSRRKRIASISGDGRCFL